MNNQNKKYAETLQRLVHICQMTNENYRRAAEHTQTSELRSLFSEYAIQREGFIEELKEHILNQGEDPEKGHGGPLDTLHQLWMNIRTSFNKTKEDDKAILKTLRSSDISALETYDDELQGGILETDLKSVLVNQRIEISIALQQIERLYFEHFPPAENQA